MAVSRLSLPAGLESLSLFFRRKAVAENLIALSMPSMGRRRRSKSMITSWTEAMHWSRCRPSPLWGAHFPGTGNACL